MLPPEVTVCPVAKDRRVQTFSKRPHATLLPAQVQQAGIRVTKSSNGYLLIAGFVSSDNSMSRYDIANYVVSHLQDPLSRKCETT